MTTRLRGNRVDFPDGTQQTTARNQPQFAGQTNYSNVRSTYANFPVGTVVGFWFLQNRSGNFNDRYKVMYKKTGNNSWSEVGG